MDEDCLPGRVFGCSLARSVAEDGRLEQLKLRLGHRNIKDFSGMYSCAIQSCHEEGSGVARLFGTSTKIRAAAAECALCRQAWRDAIKTLLRWNLRSPNRLDVRSTRSCARRGGSRQRIAAATGKRPYQRWYGCLLVAAAIC
eukprot:352715-Chlamydomonas_euryale.AAC.2